MVDEEKLVVHSKSDSIEIMINNKADEIIGRLFKQIKNRYQYQDNLESTKASEFVFGYLFIVL